MATVLVLTAKRPDVRKVAPAVSAAGSAIDVTVGVPLSADLDPRVVRAARELLGRAPRFATTCVFDDLAGPDPWSLVVDIARAVAACAPLAVLVDDNGGTFLVHPRLGLVARAEYEAARRGDTLEDFLRRLLSTSD